MSSERGTRSCWGASSFDAATGEGGGLVRVAFAARWGKRLIRSTPTVLAQAGKYFIAGGAVAIVLLCFTASWLPLRDTTCVRTLPVHSPQALEELGLPSRGGFRQTQPQPFCCVARAPAMVHDAPRPDLLYHCFRACCPQARNLHVKIPWRHRRQSLVVGQVAYMHDKNIIHRDLKGANLLLSNSG